MSNFLFIINQFKTSLFLRKNLYFYEERGVSLLTGRFCASLKHKYDGQTKFIKPNSQRQYRIIKYWVSIGSIHREQG